MINTTARISSPRPWVSRSDRRPVLALWCLGHHSARSVNYDVAPRVPTLALSAEKEARKVVRRATQAIELRDDQRNRLALRDGCPCLCRPGRAWLRRKEHQSRSDD